MSQPSSRLRDLFSAIAALPYEKRRRLLWRKVRPKYPRFLYKFRSLNPESEESITKIKEILVDSILWLSSPGSFNDPFEMAALYVVKGSIEDKKRRIGDLLKTYRKDLRWKDRQVVLRQFLPRDNEELARRAQQVHDQQVLLAGVCSFAGDPRSVLMWSHYSSDHKGLALQFEVARDTTTFFQAIGVKYQADYPVVNWLKETGDQLKSVIFQKHPAWSYERECRILVPNGANTHIRFRPEALTGIILGARAGDSVQSKIAELLEIRTRLGYPKVKLYRARTHWSRYQLLISRNE